MWRIDHPDWDERAHWRPPVTSTVVESGGEVAVLDALAPPDDAVEVWERLDAKPPTLAVVLKPDHVRDVDTFVQRYGARAFGPWLFWRDNVPETELEPVQPGSELPGGLVALYDGRAVRGLVRHRERTRLRLLEHGSRIGDHPPRGRRDS